MSFAIDTAFAEEHRPSTLVDSLKDQKHLIMNEGGYLELCNDLKKQYDAMKEKYEKQYDAMKAEYKKQLSFQFKEQERLRENKKELAAEKKQQKKLLHQTRELLRETEKQLKQQKNSYELKIQDLKDKIFIEKDKRYEKKRKIWKEVREKGEEMILIRKKRKILKEEIEAANRRERKTRRDTRALKDAIKRLKHEIDVEKEFRRAQRYLLDRFFNTFD